MESESKTLEGFSDMERTMWEEDPPPCWFTKKNNNVCRAPATHTLTTVWDVGNGERETDDRWRCAKHSQNCRPVTPEDLYRLISSRIGHASYDLNDAARRVEKWSARLEALHADRVYRTQVQTS